MTKVLLTTFAWCGLSATVLATIPRVPSLVSNIVRMLDLEQHRAADGQKAQAQANASGQPVYANGGVYLPVQKPSPQ